MINIFICVILVSYYYMTSSSKPARNNINSTNHKKNNDITNSEKQQIIGTKDKQPPANHGEKSVAICLIIRDEYRDILEWINYHKNIGVSKFYIIDDNSTSANISKAYRQHMVSKLVHHIPIQSAINKHPLTQFQKESGAENHFRIAPTFNHQAYAYYYCLKEFSQAHSFIAFIDADEFIVLGKNVTAKHRLSSRPLVDVLGWYYRFGGLTLNWIFMGSSGHIKRPAGGLIENYFTCVPDCHVKSIVNTQHVQSVGWSPHHFVYKPHYYAVDTNHKKVGVAWNPQQVFPENSNAENNQKSAECHIAPSATLYDILYIQHYVLKSREEFDIKSHKGSATNGMGRPQEFFDSLEKKIQMENRTCTELYKYAYHHNATSTVAPVDKRAV